MQAFVRELCLLGIVFSLLQSIMPQGRMKKSAMFACSLILVSYMLQSGAHFLQQIRLPQLHGAFSQSADAAAAPQDTLADELIKSVWQDAACNVICDAQGNVTKIRIVLRKQLPSVQYIQQKQSIISALCGIYDIDADSIVFVQSEE